MAPNLMPIDVRKKSKAVAEEWLANAIHDKAALHSLLCSLAIHLCILEQGSIVEIMFHRAEALAAINASLSTVEKQITNTTLLAVFTMLCIEEAFFLPEFEQEQDLSDSLDGRQIHMSGLKRMLDLRGGLQSLDDFRTLQAFILW